MNRIRLPFVGQLPPRSGASQVVHCRAHLGLSRKNFAALLGTSYSTVERWEKGRGDPGPWIYDMCRLLRTTPAGDPAQLVREIATFGPVHVLCQLIRQIRKEGL